MYLFRANVYCGPLHNNVMDCGGASSHIISPHLPPMTFLTQRLTSAVASLLPRHLLHNIYLPRCLTAMSHAQRVLLTTSLMWRISSLRLSSLHLLITSLVWRISYCNVSPCYVSHATSRLSCNISPCDVSPTMSPPTCLTSHDISRATCPPHNISPTTSPPHDIHFFNKIVVFGAMISPCCSTNPLCLLIRSGAVKKMVRFCYKSIF